MENEQLESVANDMENDYIEQIKNLKENTVSKTEYEKLKAENKKILNAYVNGQVIEGAAAAEKPDIHKLRETLANDELNNLEYVKTALDLRNAVIADGGVDPFIPWGKQISPTEEDYNCAQKVADCFQKCIDYADGDSSVFTNELMRITKDAAPMTRRR